MHKKTNLKNISIFIITILLIIMSIIKGTNQNNSHLTTKKKKLKELNNINKKLDYFNNKYLDRYISYKEKNKNISLKQIILNVNMNLDYPYYTHTKKAKNLDTPYLLVNKYYYLPENYVPKDLENINSLYAREGMMLVSSAKNAFEEMAKNAKKENNTIIAMSSYRSYDYQLNLYTNYVKNDGPKAADTYSARAGFSEHQTGLAVDIYNGKEDYTNFESTNEFKWMQENAYKYGFILRFPKAKENETGYMYESWHYRYVGQKIATYIHKNNITLEEYYVKFIENKKNLS